MVRQMAMEARTEYTHRERKTGSGILFLALRTTDYTKSYLQNLTQSHTGILDTLLGT